MAVDLARREAAQVRAEAAARSAHVAAQQGRQVPVLETSAAYRSQFRLQQRTLPGNTGGDPDPYRAPSFPGRLQRAGVKTLNGKQLEHVSGYATVFDIYYPMWDEFGPYSEFVAAGAADKTLAADPDVMFLMNHRGALMARTKPGGTMAPTLVLSADGKGLFDDVYVNPNRADVQILLSAIDDELMTEQSFSFMVVDGGWSDDFESFGIYAFDIDRGDVSGVNFGANPYTSIARGAQELMPLLDKLPASMARAAMSRLCERADGTSTRAKVGVFTEQRDASGEGEPGSIHTRRLASRINRTSARAIAAADGGTIDLTNMQLPWYEIRNADGDNGRADTAEPATVFIFDEIGGSFGVSAKTFAAELDALDVPEIRVRINSPGGSVFDSVAIYNALNHHPARISVYVDSLAASGASIIAMAGDEVVMMPGAQMMIHDAAAIQDGNAADMAKMSTFLDRQSNNLADIYRMRAGGDAAQWRGLMLAETWMFADEAVEMGLADRVAELAPRAAALADGGVTCPSCGEMSPEGSVSCAKCGAPMAAMARAYDLSIFRYAGRRHAPAPGAQRTAVAAGARSGYSPLSEMVPTGRRVTQLEAMLGLDD